MPQKPKNKAPKKPASATITCPHCRYERPANDPTCHICGYPWPWMKNTKNRRKT